MMTSGCSSLLMTIIMLGVTSPLYPKLSLSSASWVKILNTQTALESDLHVSYRIDNFDPSRFNDIHSLLYTGSTLLYAIRMPGGEGTISIPCGVITHAGTHSLTISHTNNTVIATTQFGVAWPLMAVAVPHRIETYTMDVVVRISFTKNLCNPISTSGNNNNQRVLQGGERGMVTAWMKVEKCDNIACEESKVMHIAKLENFYSFHTSKVNIQCKDWGVEGIFRVVIGAEIEEQRSVLKSESIIAKSKVFFVDWSSEYKLSTNRAAVEPCGEGDSLVVEMNYPACILDKDKIRVHQVAANHGSGRSKYIGEQRVIPGDKAVIFPCSSFNGTTSSDSFCFSYISTAVDGSVSTLRKTCLPFHPHRRTERGGWEGWSSWSECSTSCGQGVQTRYRFCVPDSYPGADLCEGPRVESRQCKLAKCSGTSSIQTTYSLATIPSPRPTPVYGASPCDCGCTYIMHSSREDKKDIASRNIDIVSGICPGLPISWTMKVPSMQQMILTLSNVSLSCSSLHLNIRDGLLPTDTIIYQVITTSAVSVKIQSSSNILHLELLTEDPSTNLTSCYAALYIRIQHGAGYSPDHPQQASFLRSEMEKVLKLSTPIILVISLSVLMVICTLIMLFDYQIKKVKYSQWRARPTSGYSTPTGGCQTYNLVEDIHTSLSTISDYVPLIVDYSMENIKAEIQLSKSVPVTPARPRRRRLLKRSETLGRSKIRLKNRRKFSLPTKVSKSKLYMSVDTVDGGYDMNEFITHSHDKLSNINPLTTNMKVIPKRRRKRRPSPSSIQAATSYESDLPRTGSEQTLKPTQSVSEFSCISADQEMEYDLYDCHLDNAMAAPGSLFAPAYWDGDATPTLELELEQLFKDASDIHGCKEDIDSDEVTKINYNVERNIPSTSPVMLRSGKSARKPLTSITSDLTSSITSAISDSTLVGDQMDTSCYYSGEEESIMTTSIIMKNEKRNIMNLTHIEEILFVDE